MTARVIDGKAIAESMCVGLRQRVEGLKIQGIKPRIVLISVGSDPASAIYLAKKEKLARFLGIESVTERLPESTTEQAVVQLIQKLNADNAMHAILLQSPLPSSLKFRRLVNEIHPDKDVDGLTVINQGRLFSGDTGVIPCTPRAVRHLLGTVYPDLTGLHAVILGRSLIVGRPLTLLLLNSNCTVTTLHSHSRDISDICRTADILVSAVGRPRFLGKEFVKPGATLIDVGVNRQDGSGKVVGDVIFEAVSEIAGAITPVPNGVGPMTVAYLMQNTLDLASVGSRVGK